MLDAACSWWLGKLLWKEDTRWKWSLFVWWRIRIVYKIWLELSFPGWLENRYYRKCAFITNDTYKQYWKASHFYMEPHQYNRGEKGASFPPHTLVSLFPLISSLIFCPSSQIKSSDIFTSFFRLLLFWITWRRSGRKETWQWQVSGHLKRQSWVPQSYARSLSRVWCPNH